MKFYGFIPVHTGQIYRSLNLVLSCAAHPRVYGGKSSWGIIGLAICEIHPRTHGADPSCRIVLLNVDGSSPRIRGRSFSWRARLKGVRFIPVYTGQILNFPKISETTKSPILSQIPAVGSVCLTFSKYIFADNAFWSKTDKITSSVFRTCFITIR